MINASLSADQATSLARDPIPGHHSQKLTSQRLGNHNVLHEEESWPFIWRPKLRGRTLTRMY